METVVIDFLQFDRPGHAGITEWRKQAGMASMMQIRLAPHDEPYLHGHLLALVPKGVTLESLANPVRDPFWFNIHDRKPKIEKSVLHFADTPGRHSWAVYRLRPKGPRPVRHPIGVSPVTKIYIAVAA